MKKGDTTKFELLKIYLSPFINYPQVFTVSRPPLPLRTTRIFRTSVPNINVHKEQQPPLFEEHHCASISNLPAPTRIAQQNFPQINIPQNCPPWSSSNDTIPSASTSTQMPSAGSLQSSGLFHVQAMPMQQQAPHQYPGQLLNTYYLLNSSAALNKIQRYSFNAPSCYHKGGW